jgi:hypothetical protein
VLIKVDDKWDAAKAIINTWGKDQTFYCGNCDEEFMPEFHKYEACCENPAMGRNVDHLMAVIKQNKMTKQLNKDQYGSTGQNNGLRVCLSFPPRLLQTLEEYFRSHNEKLFNNVEEMHKFMKRFPALCKCEVV